MSAQRPYTARGLGDVPRFTPGRELTARDLDAIARAVVRLTGGSGGSRGSTGGNGAVMVRGGADGGTSVRAEPRRREGRRRFFARITGSAGDGTNRYKYAWKEVRLGPADDGTGYDGWEDVPSGGTGEEQGRTGTTTTDPARNFWEEMNTASGVQGTGVDLDNLSGTMEHQPIPDGLIVEMLVVRSADGEAREFWFYGPQGIDGACG